MELGIIPWDRLQFGVYSLDLTKHGTPSCVYLENSLGIQARTCFRVPDPSPQQKAIATPAPTWKHEADTPGPTCVRQDNVGVLVEIRSISYSALIKIYLKCYGNISGEVGDSKICCYMR